MPEVDALDDRQAVIEWAGRSMPAAYPSLIKALTDEAERDDQVTGLLLTGSMARRDALPGTDIDVRYLVPTAEPQYFQRAIRDGIRLEQTFMSEPAAEAKLTATPMHVYAYLDGVILYDRDGALARLRDQAARIFQDYRTPTEIKQISYEALMHVEDKARVGLESGDLLKATFCLSSASWQLVEGLWAANDLPLPPHSSVRPHLHDLDGPDDIETLFERMFLANPEERVRTGLQLVGWVRNRLRSDVESQSRAS